MDRSNSIEKIGETDLSEQTKFRLDEISKNDFIEEINQRKSRSKKLSKYVAVFDYIDKILIVLSATPGGVSISQALIDMDISHEEFVLILKVKDRYEKMKDNLSSENRESC